MVPAPLSHVARQLKRSVIRAMPDKAAKHHAVSLSQGIPEGPEFTAPPEMKKVAIQAILDDANQYSSPPGAVELREAIAEHARWYLGLADVDPEQEVTVTCGASEGMFDALRAFIDPGDEVIIPQPSYESYWRLCDMMHARIRSVHRRPSDWSLELDALASAFNNRTKAIVLCNPSNPTGTVLNRSELKCIADLCCKWGVVAITDEVYEHILYDGRKHMTLAQFDGMRERAVIISSVSKTFSATGWRLGSVIAPPELTRTLRAVGNGVMENAEEPAPGVASTIRNIHDFLTICGPTPLQIGAAAAYRLPRSYFDTLSSEYQKRREMLCNVLDELGFRFVQPQGAYYVLADFRALADEDDVTFAFRLLREAGVAVVPGSCFFRDQDRDSGRSYVRFCFCRCIETLNEASRRLREWRRNQRKAGRPQLASCGLSGT